MINISKDSLPVHPDAIADFIGYSELLVSEKPLRKANLTRIKQFESTCAFCNYKNSVLTYQAHEGSFQDGETVREYHCPQCNKYTFCTKHAEY